MKNASTRLQNTIEELLKNIPVDDFRFNLFFILTEGQYTLFSIYDSQRRFLSNYRGMQLLNIEVFDKLMKNKDTYENIGENPSVHDFLYGRFKANSYTFAKKLYIYNKVVAIYEFLTSEIDKKDEIKQALLELEEASMPHLFDAFIELRQDIAKRYFSINALNVIKHARPRTFYHSFRVADLALVISRKMGLHEDSQKLIYYAGLIHDIGEMYVPRDVFYKKEDLTKDELNLIKQHPQNLKKIFEHNPLMRNIVEIAYYHHERMDGKGYYGYRKEEIPLESRILALCEVVDGLYTDRPGRKGLSATKIISILEKSKGDIFDEEVVSNSIEIIDRFYRKKELDISIIDNVSTIGKPAIVIVSRSDNLFFLQGSVEYAHERMLGISFSEDVSIEFSYREIVRIQILFFDIIYDLKAVVVSSSKSLLNLVIKSQSDITSSNLNVFWEFEVAVIPLKISSKSTEPKVIKMKAEKFGSKTLLAKAQKTKELDVLNIGDTVLIRIKPLKDPITIPAVISNIIDKYDEIVIYFEYYNVPEKTDALIHKAIYYKQSKQNALV